MKTRFVITVLFSLFTIISHAQSNVRKIIIEAQVASDDKENSVVIKSVPNANVSMGYRNDKVTYDTLKTVNGRVKWQTRATEPLYIYSKLIDHTPTSIRTILEPGDSIYIKNENGRKMFSGTGAAKMELRYRLTQLNDSIENAFPLKKQIVYEVRSLQDYLLWNQFLNLKLSVLMPVLEQYKNKVTAFAWNRIKSDILGYIEERRCSKFNGLRSGRPDTSRYNAKNEVMNVHGVSDNDLIAIYDSTMNGPAARWMDTESPEGDEDYLFYKVRMYAYRKKGEFFKKIDNSNYSVLGSETDYWVTLYKVGKEKFSGERREAVLAYLFWFVRGCLYYCGFVPETETILADYYAQSKYPLYAEVVKLSELKYRERYSRRSAAGFELTDVNGQVYSKARLKNKVAVLDFWFTGCTGCVQVAPVMRKVEAHFKDDTNVVFLSISIDREKDKWLKSIAQKKYTSGTGLNLYTGGAGKEHDIIRRYGVTGYPTIYMIDAFDKVLWADKIPRPTGDGSNLIAVIEKQLNLIKDGPYVLREGGNAIAYSVNGAAVNKKVIGGTADRVQTQTDEYGKPLDVRLQASLSIPPCQYEQPQKMLVLSDIEGNFDRFRKLLQANKVIDEKYNWTFGNGHLVFGGDMFDRGLQVTECLWLIYSLEEKAKAAGGVVHFILGNHEQMNMSGNQNYVQAKYKINAALIGKSLLQLYGPDSEIGRWLRTKNMIEKIGDMLFVHAGISRSVNQFSWTIADINRIARPYYGVREAGKSTDPMVNVLFNDDVSPMWYRIYYRSNREREAVIQNIIDSTLRKFNVNRIITGHTIVADTISVHHGGKVINTDTEHADGKTEALLIEGDHFYRVNGKGDRWLLFVDDKKRGSL